MNSTNSAAYFEEIEIPVPWGVIRGKYWGSKAQQPVVALHGWQDNSGTFDNLAPLLANDFPILCVDLPGHGLSSHYPKGQFYYIFWDGILVLRRIVKFYNWTKIKILGHSLGGAIAFLYAACYPGEVESYVSIDIASPSVRETSKLVASLSDNIEKFLKYETLSAENMPCYGYDEMMEIVYDAYKDSVNREGCNTLMKRGMKRSGDKYVFCRDPRLKVATLGFMTLDQVMEFASKITCKVQNIRAVPGMTFGNPESYGLVLDKISETASYLERHKVPGTHHIHLNDAKSIAEIIRKFLLL